MDEDTTENVEKEADFLKKNDDFKNMEVKKDNVKVIETDENKVKDGLIVKNFEVENKAENSIEDKMEIDSNIENKDHLEEKTNPEDLITIAEKLTAEELINCHQNKKNVQEPSQVLGGVFSRKTIIWTGASWEQDEIERRLENWSKPLSHYRVETRNSMNQGEWRPELGKVKLNRWTGKMFEFMGTAINISMWLWPEEALYLLECSQLDLQYGEVSMSLQRAYTTLLSGKLALERYLVYFKLLKFGYRVVRHQGDLEITAYERCIGLDKYEKVNRKMKSLKGTQIMSKEEINATTNQDESSIDSDVMKLEEDIDIRVEDVNLCDISAFNNDCDKVNAKEKSGTNLNKRKTDEDIIDENGDIYVSDTDNIQPSKKKRVEERDSVKINEAAEKVCNKTDISEVIEVSINNKSARKTAGSNVPTAAVTSADTDVVMLSSDEEFQPQKSPKYKVLDEKEEPDIVDLSSDEEFSAPSTSTATAIQFPSSNYNNASTSEQNVVQLDDASFIESAISTVSTNQIRLVNENIQLLQKDLPTGFVNPGQFLCNVCKVTCNSEETYKVHISGKKHKACIRRLPRHLQQKQLDQQQNQSSGVNNKSPKASGSNSELYCSACNVQSESLIGLRVHLMGKRHIKMLKNIATNPQAATTDQENGIIEMDITQKFPLPKDSKKLFSPRGIKETPITPNDPSPNGEEIRIITSKASLMNNIPNCYGKALVNLKVMDQFVPKGCNPSKETYTIAIGKQPEKNYTEDLELEKEVSEKDKYKYTCRVCDIPLPDNNALMAHIRSPQHVAKLNRPELASVQDNQTIIIDDYGVVKDKDRLSRGYYPKHEQECFFKGGMSGTVYNFGYHIPLKEHSRRRLAAGKKYKKGQQSFNPQDRKPTFKKGNRKGRQMKGITADDIVQEEIVETNHKAKENTDNTNMVDKDQDVINLSSDDETHNNCNNISTKEVIDNIDQVDGANSEIEAEVTDNNGEVADNDEEEDNDSDGDSIILEDLSRNDSRSSSFDSDDSSNIDDVESHPELRLLKKSSLGSLWSYEGKVGPLISPEMAEDMNTIFKRIQGAPQPRKHFRKSTSKDLEIAFDCYKSSSNYRKSINMAPDYRVVLVDPRDQLPDNSQMLKLQNIYKDRVPVLFAIVDRGTVSLITMDSLNLPTFYDDIVI